MSFESTERYQLTPQVICDQQNTVAARIQINNLRMHELGHTQ